MALTFKTYRTNDIDVNLRKMRIRPLDVMVVGATGAGKSTTLNAFFFCNIARVGTGVDPETMELESYKLNDFFRVWDTPGLGDGVKKDQIHKKKIIDLLYKEYTLEGKTYGLSKDSVVLLEQIRTIDKKRLKERMGKLDDSLMNKVDSAIAVSFGLH